MTTPRQALIAAALVGAGCSNTTIGRTPITISADPLSVSFGSQPAGARLSRTVTLRNDGLAILVLSQIAITGDARGAFSAGPAPTSLSPATSATFQVTYAAPDATGADGASLTVSSNADNAPQLSIPLSGQSVAACAAESDAAFCTRVGKNCGKVTAPDNCGTSRAVASCGLCTGAQTCGGNGVANVCGAPAQHTLSVTVAGSGTVTSSPAGLSCTSGTCSATFNAGTAVTLTATPAQYSAFSGWSGGSCSGSAAATCTVTLAGSDAATTATFAATASYAIGGAVTGLSGSGLVLANSLNGGAAEQLPISLNGNFVFPTRAPAGQTYAVSILTQPSSPAQACTLTGGSGSARADIASVMVSCPPFVAGTSPSSPNLLVANATTVYFTTSAEIYSLPVTGGTPAAFAPIAMANGIQGCYGLALDASYLYFTEYAAGRLNKVTLASPNALTNMNSFGYSTYYAHGMQAAGGNVYWGGYAHGQVELTPAGGSSITELFNPGFTYDTPNFAADSTNLYWSSNPNGAPYNSPNQGAIYQLPLTATSGAGAVTLASGLAGPNSLATTSGYVYWTDNANNNVKAVPIGGTAVTTVAPAETGASSIVSDSGAIYWVDVLNSSSSAPSSAIRTCTIGTGGACGPIATVATVGDYVTSLAVSGQSLVWVGTYSFKIWQSRK